MGVYSQTQAGRTEMNLIWRISAPNYSTGIGVVTSGLIPMMINDGHRVLIVHSDGEFPSMKINGIDVCGVRSAASVEFIRKGYNFDYIFTNPGYKDAGDSYSNAVVLISFDFIEMPEKLSNDCKYGKYFFTVSKHNQRMAEEAGFISEYAPWGIDSNLFSPDYSRRKEFRRSLGISDDTFLIGCVGGVYWQDRKNLQGLIEAFNIFSEQYKDSKLYLHTLAISEMIWSDVNKNKNILFCDQGRYILGNISQYEMSEAYNGFDVFCLPTKGEAYGIPLIEAQACGCPVIATDTSACTEHVFGGWLIPSEPSDGPYDSKWGKTKVEDIVKSLELAYINYKEKKYFTRHFSARLGAVELDWDKVYPKYWKPFLKKLDNYK